MKTAPSTWKRVRFNDPASHFSTRSLRIGNRFLQAVNETAQCMKKIVGLQHLTMPAWQSVIPKSNATAPLSQSMYLLLGDLVLSFARSCNSSWRHNSCPSLSARPTALSCAFSGMVLGLYVLREERSFSTSLPDACQK